MDQAFLRHFVVVIIIILLLIIYQINHKHRPWIQAIKLEPRLQNTPRIEHTPRNIKIDIPILERQAHDAEMLMMRVLKLIILLIRVGAVENQDAIFVCEAE
ncbi:hypothetical protein ACHAQH_004264 [Verticillium albo-atrum]